MKPGIKKIWLLFMGLSLSGLIAVNSSAQDLQSLLTPPADSADAENLRIWYSIERKSRCQFSLEVYTRSQQKVRQLLNKSIGPGYYNFYWDKKDDSGRFVEPGLYVYKLVDCGKTKYGNLKVKYRKWENTSFFYQDTSSDSMKVTFEFLEDSARVSLSIYNAGMIPKANPFTDSLMNRGQYSYTWKPEIKLSPGYYIFRLQIDDFIRELKILYRK